MNNLRTRHNRDAWSAWHEKNRSPVESSTERDEPAKGPENSSAVTSVLLSVSEPPRGMRLDIRGHEVSEDPSAKIAHSPEQGDGDDSEKAR